MESKTTDFLGLIKGPRQYRIPSFQRAYSWEKEQRDTLWLDVLNQYARLRDIWHDPDRELKLGLMAGHYLGTVVLAGPSALGVPKSDVIDGQQRVTTLLLMLCALRDVRVRSELRRSGVDSQERAQAVRKRFQRRYLVNEDEDGPDELRVVPLKADRQAFRAVVNHDGIGHLTADSIGLTDQDSQRVLQAYKFFLTELRRKEIDEEKNPQLARFADLFPLDLDILEEAITRRLTLITIETANVDDVNSIFESLNATGRPLSQLDLLRNYIFMALRGKAESVLETQWSAIEVHLHRPIEIESYIWADIVSRGTSVLQKRTYRTVQAELRQKGSSPEVAEEYLTRLSRLAPAYASILHPDREKDAALRRGIDKVNRAGGSTASPLLLWLLRLRNDGKMSTEQVVEALAWIESFLVRRMLAGSATNLLSSIFGQVLNRVHSESLLHEPPLARLQAAMTQNPKDWPSDEIVAAGIRNVDFYHSQKAQQRIHVLASLDHALAPNTVLNYEQTDDSIEHILPQSRPSAWVSDVQEIGDDFDHLHAKWLHTLSNLTVVTPPENAALGARRFAEKAEIYSDSQYALTRQLAEQFASESRGHQYWGTATLEARADQLAELASAVWPRPDIVATEKLVIEYDLDEGEEPVGISPVEEEEILQTSSI